MRRWHLVGLAVLGSVIAGACADFGAEDGAKAVPPDGGADGSIAEAGPDVAPQDAGDGAPPRACDPNKDLSGPVPYGSLGSGVGNRDSAWIVPGGVFTTEIATDLSSEILYGAFAANERPGALAHVSLTEAGGALRNTSWLTVAADGKTAYVIGTSQAGKIGIWRATLQPGSPPSFGNAVLIVSKERVYTVSLRGNTLLYAEQETGRGYELRSATLDGAGNVVRDEKLPLLNTVANEAAPVMTADGLRLYWGSDRPDDNASASWNVWTATRASLDETFSNPRRVVELDTPGFEIPTWISDDDCTMLLSTSQGRSPGTPGTDIFIARRP